MLVSSAKLSPPLAEFHSNVLSVLLFKQKLRFDVHWYACLPVCLLNGNAAKLKCLLQGG